MTAALYVGFLGNTMVPDYTQLLLDIQTDTYLNRKIWFQHDGAQPHFTATVSDFLNRAFPDRWIGRREIHIHLFE